MEPATAPAETGDHPAESVTAGAASTAPDGAAADEAPAADVQVAGTAATGEPVPPEPAAAVGAGNATEDVAATGETAANAQATEDAAPSGTADEEHVAAEDAKPELPLAESLTPKPKVYRVWLGARGKEDSAKTEYESLQQAFRPLLDKVVLQVRTFASGSGTVYRIYAGEFQELKGAQALCDSIRSRDSGQFCRAVIN